MDSLKTLMDNKNYELVVKLTETTDDNVSLFYRISALLALGKGEEAILTIKSHRKSLQKNLKDLIRIHIEILCILEKFDEAYQEVEYYQNLPYESQEVEELLKKLPGYVKDEERKIYRNTLTDDKTLTKQLLSDDGDVVLAALDTLRDRDINLFLNYVAKILLDFPKQSIRSFALLVLVQKKVDRNFKFNSLGNIINVNPSKLNPPFVDDSFNSFSNKIHSLFNNPVLSENAIQILSSYLLYIYPENVNYSTKEFVVALYRISCKLLMSDENNLILLNKIGDFDENEVNLLIEQMNPVLKEF